MPDNHGLVDRAVDDPITQAALDRVTQKDLDPDLVSLWRTMVRLVEHAPDYELMRWALAISKMSTTNCGWDEYGAGKVVGPLIEREAKHRRSRNRKAT